MRTSSSPFISASNEQPTPQYAQVVLTVRVGMPSSMMLFSCSAVVGHAWTQAPHDTHSDSMNDVPDAEIIDSNPRPSTVSASVPWISSHARTQREQTMHAFGSKLKYGLLESTSAGRRWV